MIDNLPMRYTELLFALCAILMCSTIFAVIRIGAWLLSVYPVRAEAVVEWQDCDIDTPADWDAVDAALADQPDEVLPGRRADFAAWRDELLAEPGIAKRLRRMERWSA